MNRIIKLSLLEYKKVMQRPGIYIGMILATLYSLAIAIQAVRYPQAFQAKHVYAFYASIAGIVVFVYAAKSLGEEFKFRTSTALFTNSFPRGHIVFSKLIGLCLVGITLAILNSTIVTISKVFLHNDLTILSVSWDFLRVCFIYIVYTFCVGSFGLLISSISFSTTVSLIVCIASFWFFSSTVDLIVQKFEKIQLIAKAIPFYSASPTLTYFSFGKIEISSLIISGVIFTALSIFILNKRDLR